MTGGVVFLQCPVWGSGLDFSEKGVDNRYIFVLAGHCLHRSKASSAPCATPPARRLEVHKELGEDTGAVTPSDKGNIPDHDSMLGVQREEGGRGNITIILLR